MTIPAPLAMAPGILFAAGFDWLEALLPFLFVAFWIVSQVIAAIKRLGNGQRPARPQPRFDPDRDPRGAAPMARGAPRMDGGDAADARADLDRQIAEFLREMTERKQQPAGRAAGERAAGPAAPRPRSQKQARPPQPAAARGAAGSIPAAGRRPAPEQAANREAKREAKGGAVPATAAEPTASVAAHVSEVFGKEMAHLRGDIQGEAATTRLAAAAASPAQELVAMLRDPRTVRQLVLIREVLERPVDRW
ncbi:MAG: hypothetical protein ACKOTB_09695 [Planctomycetia bacterium]